MQTLESHQVVSTERGTLVHQFRSAAEFVRAMDYVHPATGVSIRPCDGVWIITGGDGGENLCEITATDGRILSVTTIPERYFPISMKLKDRKHCIQIPRDCIEAVKALFKRIGGTLDVYIDGDGGAQLRAGGLYIGFSRAGCKFPPTDWLYTTLDKSALVECNRKEALKNLAKYNAGDAGELIWVGIRGGEVCFAPRGLEKLPMPEDWDKGDVFNARYFKQALRAMKSKTFLLQLCKPGAHCYLAGEGVTHLIMPVTVE